MLKRVLLIAIVALAQFGCGFEYGEDRSPVKFAKLSDKTRKTLEGYKRDLLKIEDLQKKGSSLWLVDFTLDVLELLIESLVRRGTGPNQATRHSIRSGRAMRQR